MRFNKSNDQTLSKETNVLNEICYSSNEELCRIATPSTQINPSHVGNVEQAVEQENLIGYLSCYNMRGRNHLMRRNALGDIWNFEA